MKAPFTFILLLLIVFMSSANADVSKRLGKEYKEHDKISMAMFATGTLTTLAGRHYPSIGLFSVGIGTTTAAYLTASDSNYRKSVRDWEIAQVDFLNRVRFACERYDSPLMLEQLNLLSLYHLFFATEYFNKTDSRTFYCNVIYNNLAQNPEFYLLGAEDDKDAHLKKLLEETRLGGCEHQEEYRIKFLLRMALNLYSLDESRLFGEINRRSRIYNEGRRRPSRFHYYFSQLAIPSGTTTVIASGSNVGISAGARNFFTSAGLVLALSGFASNAILVELPKHIGINQYEFDSFIQRSRIVCARPEELEYFRLEQFFNFFTFKADSENNLESKIKEVFCNVIPALADIKDNDYIDVSYYINPEFFDDDEETLLRFEALRLNFRLMLER